MIKWEQILANNLKFWALKFGKTLVIWPYNPNYLSFNLII